MKTFTLNNLLGLIIVNLVLLSGSNLLAQDPKPIVRVMLNSNNSSDETVFYFDQGGTADFQSSFDAYKLLSGNTPYIASLSSGSILTSINGLPALPVNIEIPVKAISPVTKTFTFSAEQTDFPSTVCVSLYDKFTNTTIPILNTNYICTLFDTTSIARFTMRFYTSALEATTLVKNPSCSSPLGVITAKGNDNGPWNYEWKIGDSIVRTVSNKNDADTLPDLNGGNYSVKISSNNQCSSFTTNFLVESVVATKADFTSNVSSVSLSTSGHVNFTNNSTNARFSVWEFGDETGSWYAPAPDHNYLSEGIYTVRLITESITHCKDTATQTILVIDDITGVPSLGKNGEIRLATLSQGNYELHFLLSEPGDFELELTDLNGRIVRLDKIKNVTNLNYALSIENQPQGMYLLNLRSENSQKTFKLIK
jgi:hypothetical protein